MSGNAFWDAVFDNNVTKVKELLLKPDFYDFNWPNPRTLGFTPMHVACAHGYVEIVRLLLNDPNVKVNAVNHLKQTPFYLALLFKQKEVLDILCENDRVDISKTNRFNYPENLFRRK